MASSHATSRAETHFELRLGRFALGSSVIVQLLGGGVAYVSQVMLARWLSDSGFGRYSAALSAVGVLGLIATLGSTGAALRFVPPARKANDLRAAERYIAFASWSCLVGASILAIAVLLLTPTIGMTQSDGLALAILIVLSTFLNFGNDVGRALGRNISTYGASVVVRPSVTLIFASAALLAADRPSVSTGLWVADGAAGIAVFVQMIAIRRTLESFQAFRPRLPSTEWIRRSPAFLLGSGLTLLLSQVDLLAVSAVLPARETSYYAAATRLAASMSLVTVAVNTLLAPKVAAATGPEAATGLTILSRSAARWSTAGSSLIALPLLLAPGLILGLFGSDFDHGRWVLVALVLGQLVSISCGPSGVILMYRDTEKLALISFAVFVVANAAASVGGAYVAGIDGAAFASGSMLALNGVSAAALAWYRLRVLTIV